MGGQHVLHAQSDWLHNNYYYLHSFSLLGADHYIFERGGGLGNFQNKIPACKKLLKKGASGAMGKNLSTDFLLPLF